MLKLAGILNIIIALAHIRGLLWAKKMFKVTGISNTMSELTSVHVSLPYILTVIVAFVFFIFGLYGLSADGGFIRLPFLKYVIFGIAGIYILRGISQLIYQASIEKSTSLNEKLFSFIAIGIGLLFLLGGLNKWF